MNKLELATLIRGHLSAHDADHRAVVDEIVRELPDEQLRDVLKVVLEPVVSQAMRAEHDASLMRQWPGRSQWDELTGGLNRRLTSSR